MANAADAVAAIAATRDAQKQANMAGGEWRDTGKTIKKAGKLLTEGKTEEAAKLAQQAEAQGMLGYMQASSLPVENCRMARAIRQSNHTNSALVASLFQFYAMT